MFTCIMQDRVKLMSGLGIVVFLIVLVGAITLYQTILLESEFYVIENETTNAIIALGNIESNIFFVTLEAHEYILDPVPEHLIELQEGKEKLLAAMDAYESAEAGDEPKEVAYFKAGISKIVSSVDEIVTLKDSGASMNDLLEKSKALDSLVEEYLHELEKETARDMIHLSESHESIKNVIYANYYLIIVIGISVIMSVLLTFLFSKSK